MGIVLTQRINGDNVQRLAAAPGRRRIPALTVAWRIFKVAVLNQFGIESAVSSVTDILEEDADEFVADDLLLTADSQHGLRLSPLIISLSSVIIHSSLLSPLSSFLSPLSSVIMHPLTAQAGILSQPGKVGLDRGQFRGGYLKLTAFVQRASDGGRVARPGHILYLARLILTEAAEVARGRHPALVAALGLIIDVKRSVVIGEYDGSDALAGAHDRIVLRTPVDEVAAIGGCQQRTPVVHLEHQPPRAVLGPCH